SEAGEMYMNLADICIQLSDVGEQPQKNGKRAIVFAKRTRRLIPKAMETRYLHGRALNAEALGRQIIAQLGHDTIHQLRIALKQLQTAITLVIPNTLDQAKSRLNFAATTLLLHRLTTCSPQLLQDATKHCKKALRL